MALEIMVATPAIRNLIREEKIHQIYSAMQAGQKFGMQTMNQSLAELVQKRRISREEALNRSTLPEELAGAARRDGHLVRRSGRRRGWRLSVRPTVVGYRGGSRDGCLRLSGAFRRRDAERARSRRPTAPRRSGSCADARSSSPRSRRRARPGSPFKFGGKVKDKEMAIFTRQFSTMIDAGLPLVQCLNILAEQSDSKTLPVGHGQVARDVEGGLDAGRRVAHGTRGPSTISSPTWSRSGRRAVSSTSSCSGSPPTSRRRPP